MTEEAKKQPSAKYMELRDYFAAKMMPIACKTTTNAWAVARMSYEYADAMVAVREEGKK